MEQALFKEFPELSPILPKEIHFVHSEELAKRWPDKSPKEREDLIVAEYPAVFIGGIGNVLPSCSGPHDLRYFIGHKELV